MPRITKAWCAENPEQYHELARPPERCPLCLEAFSRESPANSPVLGDRASSCRHWACADCWLQIMEGPPRSWRCPFCREKLQTWMSEAFAEDYSPPADAVGPREVRHFASKVLRLFTLPADLEVLARSILRHMPAE